MYVKKRLVKKFYYIRIIVEPRTSDPVPNIYKAILRPLFGPRGTGTARLQAPGMYKHSTAISIEKARRWLHSEHVFTINDAQLYGYPRKFTYRPAICFSMLYDDGTKVDFVRRGTYKSNRNMMIFAIDAEAKVNKHMLRHAAPSPMASEVMKIYV